MRRDMITGLCICLAVYSVASKAQAPASSDVKVQTRPLVIAPAPQLVEGQSIETETPEKPDDRPLFPQQTRAPYHASAPFRVTTITDQLHAPWGLAFLPDGKFLVSERLPGTLRIVDSQGNMSQPLTGTSAAASTPLYGILDVALDPHFASNRRVFFTFFDCAAPAPGQNITNSNTYVARAELDEAANQLRDVTVIFRSIPAWPSKRLGAKTGGRIAIGRDGNLFVTIGDRDDGPHQITPDWMSAQQLDNDLGKVIHITPDGQPVPGNPFLTKAGARPELWAYGIRSPEGLAFNPRTGELWETELGPRGGDKVNIIKRGENYGWPVIVHGIDYPGTAIGAGITHKAGMQQPVYYWDPSRDPSGMAFYKGALFPQWQNSLFVAMLDGKFLDRLTLSRNKVVSEEPLLVDMHTRVRDVRVGPDGAVYVLTDSGTSAMSPSTPAKSKLLKLTPR